MEIEDFILKNSAKNRSEITLKRKEKRRNAESRREKKTAVSSFGAKCHAGRVGTSEDTRGNQWI